MPASLIHLVRHGEVFNPDGILYGRIPGFGLSELGHRMAESAAVKLADHDVRRLIASPLQRAQESARPWAEAFGLDIETDERVIEPTNKFEGKKFEFGAGVLRRPSAWPWVVNPWRPSWGEPFASIAASMRAAMTDAVEGTDEGEVVIVSHQSPIWMATRAINGLRLPHDPRRRRCNLSSITTFEPRAGTRTGFVETNYQDPAAALLAQATDTGAV